MGFDDRLVFLILGGVIGFILGYIVRSLRDIKEELDEMLEKNEPHKHDESGFVRHPVVMDVALLLVIFVTVWAAFASQRASNDVQDTQDTLTRVTFCNQQYLSKTIAALNERTTYTQEQAHKNVDLQQSQFNFLSFLIHKPPYSEEKRAKSALRYVNSVHKFVEISKKSADQIVQNPYPTNKELRECLKQAVE